MKPVTRVFLAALLLTLAGGAALAGLFRAENQVEIDSGTYLEENLTAAGRTVSFYGETAGDIVAAGRTLRLEGVVGGQIIAVGQQLQVSSALAGDALLFGQNIHLYSPTLEDLRAAGQYITVDSDLSGDLLAAGQRIHLSRTSIVGGDVSIGGQHLILDGQIFGKLVAAGAAIEIGGKIDGDADLYGENIQFIGEGYIAGDLTVHYENQRPEIPVGVVGGILSYEQIECGKKDGGLLEWLLWCAAAIVTGLLFVLAFRRCLQEDLDEAYSHPFKTMGWGAAVLVGVPVAIVIGFVLVFTIPISLMLLLTYLPLLYAGWIFGGLLLGQAVLRRLTHSDPSPYYGVLTGMGLLLVLAFIPYLGGWILALAMVTGMGIISRGFIRIARR